MTPKPNKKVVGGIFAVMLACCGGTIAIGAASPVDDPAPAASRPAPRLADLPSAAPSSSRVSAPVTPSASRQTARPKTRPTTTAPRDTQEPRPVYYANCKAAQAAGATPLRRGEPGYRRGLDRDNDGEACGSD